MKNEFRLAIAAILLLLPNAGRAQWLTQTFELKGGWNAIYLHVDASHTDVVGALGYDLSTINQSPVDQIWAWAPKPNSIQFIQSPQAPVNNSSRWFEWRKDMPGYSELQKIRGNTGYLVHANLQPNQIYKLRIIGKPVLPRYEWTTSGLNFIGFPTPLTSPPNFDQYFVHSPELHRNGEIYLYNGGALSDGTNPARLFSLSSTEVRRGEAMWIRGTAGQYSNYFGPLKVTLQDPDGVHLGDSLKNYRVIVRNMSSKPITIKLAQLPSEVPPTGQPIHVASPPLVVRGELNTEILDHNYFALNAKGREWELESKNEPGSAVEIILGVDRSKMNQISGNLYAGLLRITDNLSENSQTGGGSQGMTQIDLQVTATVPSMEGLWVGEALVDEVRHDLTSYENEDEGDSVQNNSSKTGNSPAFNDVYFSFARNLSITGWTRLRGAPVSGELYGIVGETQGGYLAVNHDRQIVLGFNDNKKITTNKFPIHINEWNHLGVTFTGSYENNNPKALNVEKGSLYRPKIEIESIKTGGHHSVFASDNGEYALPPPNISYDITTSGEFAPKKINNQTNFSFIKFKTNKKNYFAPGDQVRINGVKNVNFVSEYYGSNVFTVHQYPQFSNNNTDWEQHKENAEYFYINVPGNMSNIETTEGGTTATKVNESERRVDNILESDGSVIGSVSTAANTFSFQSGQEIMIVGGVKDTTTNAAADSYHNEIFTIKSVENVYGAPVPGEEYRPLIARKFEIDAHLGLGDIYDSESNNLLVKNTLGETKIVTTKNNHGFAVGDTVKITLNKGSTIPFIDASTSVYNDSYIVKRKISNISFEIFKIGLANEADIIAPNDGSAVAHVKKYIAEGAVATITDVNSEIEQGDTVYIRGGTGANATHYNGEHQVETVTLLDDGSTEFTYLVDPSVSDPQGSFYAENAGTYVTEIAAPESNGITEVVILGSNNFYAGNKVRFTGGNPANNYFKNKEFEVIAVLGGENSPGPSLPKGHSGIFIQIPPEDIGSAESAIGLHIELVGEVRFYLNGDYVESHFNNIPFMFSRGSSDTLLGKAGEGGTPYQGDIENLKIYDNLTLNDQQIHADYMRKELAGDYTIKPNAGPVSSLYQGDVFPSSITPVSRNSKFGKVKRPYKLRLLFHHDSGGSTRLLQRVYVGLNNEGDSILTNQESALDPKSIDSAARMSAVHLPFSKENVPWLCEGSFGISGSLNADVSISYNNHSNNPFLHTYHPDHDNVDSRYESELKIGNESWSINRGMKFIFKGQLAQEDNNNRFNDIGWGASLIGGEFHELITLKGKQVNYGPGVNKITRNEAKQYEVRGAFALKRVSDINNLFIK